MIASGTCRMKSNKSKTNCKQNTGMIVDGSVMIGVPILLIISAVVYPKILNTMK